MQPTVALGIKHIVAFYRHILTVIFKPKDNLAIGSQPSN